MKFLPRVFAIAWKELRQLRRDRLSLGMIVGIPLIQITLFGYAINTDLRHLRAAVADMSGTASSRALTADLAASQVVDIAGRAGSAKELEDMLRRGEISIGLYIPPDFERRLLRGDRAAAQLLIDGSDPQVSSAASGLTSIPAVERGSRVAASRAIFERRLYYNPERRSAVNIVPGLAGVILTMTMVLFTAIAIVRERERGTLEMLITTPVRTSELMIGKILPYIFIGLVQITLVLGLGVFLFRLPIRGDLLQFYAAALLFIATSLSLGLLISTLAKSQFQAMQMTFFYFLPSILLSGFMFPFSGMPPLAQGIGEILPLTHFIRLVRGIILRGATLGELAVEMIPLAIFLAVTLSLSILRFRKRLD